MTKLSRKVLLIALALTLVLTLTLAACKENATVSFVGGDGATGTAPNAINTTVGETIQLPENTFAKQGYVFAGWKSGDTTLQPKAMYIVESASVQFVAQWTAEEPEVTLTSITATYYGTIALNGMINDQSLVVMGHYSDGSMHAVSGYIVDIDTSVAGSQQAEITYTEGGITKTYSITIDVVIPAPTTYALTYAAGDHGTGTTPAAEQKEAGAKVTLAAATLFTAASGYEFDGWSDGTTKYAAGAEFTMPAKAVTLTAQWKLIKHTVTFDPNNEGATWTKEVEYGQTVAKPVDDPTISSGKTFRYWKTEGGSEYDFTTPVTQDLELTAVYAWKVTFAIGEGATGTAPEDQWVNMWTGFGIELPQATGLSNGDKVFAGWSDGEETYQAGDRYVGIGNHTLTAVWQDAPDASKHTLKFTVGAHGAGTPPAAIQLAEGESTTLPDGTGLRLADGFEDEVFLGWSLTWNSEILKAGSTYVMPGNDVSLQARWGKTPAPAQQYSVTWVKSDKENLLDSVAGDVPEAQQVLSGNKITMPAANTLTLAHYTLTKWRVQYYDSQDEYWATITNVNPGEEYTMPAQAIRIVAVWTANNVTISFDANGGSGEIAPVTNKQYNSTYSAPQTCAFTAPAGMEFDHWSTTPNGSAFANGTKLDANVVSANDTLTLYAVWKSAAVVEPDAPSIDQIKGAWTATDHTLDIISYTDADNEPLVGYAILDGQHLMYVVEDNNVLYIYNSENPYIDNEQTDDWDLNSYYIGYSVSLAQSKLTLTSLADETVTVEFSGQAELTNAAHSTFEGKWSRTGTNQPWVVTENEIRYGLNLSEVSSSVVIGNNIVLVYKVSDYNYIYVLSKQGDNLEGWYDVAEKAPAAVTFAPATYLTLTVDGVLNQIVNSGSAPDASKIAQPEAPEGKVFSKWVIAGTETEADLTAVITEDLAIEAVFIDDEGASGAKTYIGVCTVTVSGSEYTVSQFVIDFDKLEGKATVDDVESDITDMKAINPVPGYVDKIIYGEDISYFKLYIKFATYVERYIIVNADKTKITFCNDQDEPYFNGEFVLKTGEEVESEYEKVKLSEISDKIFVSEGVFYTATSAFATTNYSAAKVTYDSNSECYKLVFLQNATTTGSPKSFLPKKDTQVAESNNIFTIVNTTEQTLKFAFKKTDDGKYQLILISWQNASGEDILQNVPITLEEQA